MTIQIEPEFENKIRDAAQRSGKDVNGYIHAALLRQIVADSLRGEDNDLDAEMQMAANDPLFLEDMAEIEHDFTSADAETARMIGDA